MESSDIILSIQENSKNDTAEKSAPEVFASKSFSDFIIVNKSGPIYMIEKFFFVLVSLISPYIYAWFAVFGTPVQGSKMYWVMIGMESFFLFNIIFSFFVELKIDG